MKFEALAAALPSFSASLLAAATRGSMLASICLQLLITCSWNPCTELSSLGASDWLIAENAAASNSINWKSIRSA